MLCPIERSQGTAALRRAGAYEPAPSRDPSAAWTRNDIFRLVLCFSPRSSPDHGDDLVERVRLARGSTSSALERIAAAGIFPQRLRVRPRQAPAEDARGTSWVGSKDQAARDIGTLARVRIGPVRLLQLRLEQCAQSFGKRDRSRSATGRTRCSDCRAFEQPAAAPQTLRWNFLPTAPVRRARRSSTGWCRDRPSPDRRDELVRNVPSARSARDACRAGASLKSGDPSVAASRLRGTRAPAASKTAEHRARPAAARQDIFADKGCRAHRSERWIRTIGRAVCWLAASAVRPGRARRPSNSFMDDFLHFARFAGVNSPAACPDALRIAVVESGADPAHRLADEYSVGCKLTRKISLLEGFSYKITNEFAKCDYFSQ